MYKSGSEDFNMRNPIKDRSPKKRRPESRRPESRRVDSPNRDEERMKHSRKFNDLPNPLESKRSGSKSPIRQSSRLDSGGFDSRTDLLGSAELVAEKQTSAPAKPPKQTRRNSGNFQKTGDSMYSPLEINEPESKHPSPSHLNPAPVTRKNEKPKGNTNNPPDRFTGQNIIQYGQWAHFLAYGAAAMCIVLGTFSIIWTDAHFYECKISGDKINEIYLFDETTGVCPTTYEKDGKIDDICCHEDASSSPTGFFDIGVVYVVFGLFIFLYEDVTYGYGVFFPNDTVFYKNKVSLIGIVHIIVGSVGLSNFATCMAGAFLITTGAVYGYAAYRQESGDGGRSKKRAANAKKKATEIDESWFSYFRKILSFNPVSFFKRIYNEDKLSSYVWVFIFVAANVILFTVVILEWYGLIGDVVDDMLDGTLDVTCSSIECKVNRKMVKFGPISIFAPWAKACGGCLNMNCSLLLLPIIRMLLRKLNNWGSSANPNSGDLCGNFFARPLTRYIPLQKNIEFHKLCAGAVFIFAWGHFLFHLLNLTFANKATLRFFRLWSWDGTAFFTGALVTYAMYIIYSGAPEIVRASKYEMFFRSHHLFILFYFALFLHGPVFFFWAAIPVLLYVIERYMQIYRGNRPYLLEKVEWIPPVMAIYFRPVFKEDFQFKEGQYLYLNCPHVSETEWHPFTISSAKDDLYNGPRIHLETGEEVVEVPRPAGLPSTARWNRYCLVSQDWRKMDPQDFLEKGDTGYLDFISVHVKVHGLDEPYARTWTRKVKEYFELLSPGRKFPFYFNQRDSRGDIVVGKRIGPDAKPILRVDGPHSAPSEQYTNYGTVMLIGAGIGLTPCASILCALTKYRWKKNFNPEIVHFYWMVRQNEMDSYQWLVHLLTDLSFELKRGKANRQIEKKYYCEINIYVTGVEKNYTGATPLHKSRKISTDSVKPSFTAEELYEAMVNPTVLSKNQISKMQEPNPPNRLQDIWIWNGRPNWDEIFQNMKEQRQHSDIGVCFCGAAVIGADLRAKCEKYSNVDEDCLFSLHKENF